MAQGPVYGSLDLMAESDAPTREQCAAAWSSAAGDLLALHARVAQAWEASMRGDDYATLEEVRRVLTAAVRAPLCIQGPGLFSSHG